MTAETALAGFFAGVVAALAGLVFGALAYGLLCIVSGWWSRR